MKIFKKCLLLFVCASLLFSTACTQTKTYTLFSGSYWLKDHTVGDVTMVKETCTYSLSITGSENSNLYMFLDESSVFTTTLEDSIYNGTKCYKFSTSLVLKGHFLKGTEKTEFSDYQTSECYFLGMSEKFAPLYSSKIVATTTPFTSGDSFIFPRVEYTYETVYDNNSGNANVKVVCGENTTKGYEVQSYERTFEKFNGRTFIDSQLFLFFPRVCKFEEGFTQTFYTLDVLAQTIHPMRIGVNASAPTSEITLDNYHVNGASKPNAKKNTYNVLIQINSNFSGSALEFNYNATAGYDNLNSLIRYAQQLPLNLGKLTYTLKNISSTEISL